MEVKLAEPIRFEFTNDEKKGRRRELRVNGMCGGCCRRDSTDRTELASAFLGESGVKGLTDDSARLVILATTWRSNS